MAKVIKVGSRNIDVSGLSKTQVQKVIEAAKRGGSLSSRALAQQFQKQAPTPRTSGVPTIQAAGFTDDAPGRNDVSVPEAIQGKQQYKTSPDYYKGTQTGVSDSGTINIDRLAPTVTKAEEKDYQRNFNVNNPGVQVDEFGNRQDIVFDPMTGKTKIVRTGGGAMSATLDAFGNAITGFTSDLSSQVNKAQEANYNYLTRNLENQKRQEIEAAKQELAQRGIPIDANPNSLWAQTTKGINDRYQNLYDQANQQSIMLGNDTLTAQTGAQAGTLGALTNTAQAFRQSATPYAGSTVNQSDTLLDVSKTTSGANLTNQEIAARKKIAEMQAKANKAPASSNVVFNG